MYPLCRNSPVPSHWEILEGEITDRIKVFKIENLYKKISLQKNLI